MAVLGCVIGGSNYAEAQTYDVAKDFYSVAAPPGNPWSYGTLSTFPVGDFHPLSFSGDFRIGKNTVSLWNNKGTVPSLVTIGLNRGSTTAQFNRQSVIFPPNVVNLDPENLVADVRWTAPFDGVFQITLSLQHDDTYGGGNPVVNVGVIQTDNSGNSQHLIGPFSISPPSSPPLSPFSTNISLVKVKGGNTIDFAITGTNGAHGNMTTGFSVKIETLAVTSPPKPVLVLCADRLVTDGFCNSIDPTNTNHNRVGRWENIVGQAGRTDGATLAPLYHGAQQPDLLRQPQLVTEGGRNWVRFDGGTSFLTTFFGDANWGPVPASTLIVVMKLPATPAIAGDNDGSSDFPFVYDQSQLPGLYNLPMTIIGNQMFQIMSELGIATASLGGSQKIVPDYRFFTFGPVQSAPTWTVVQHAVGKDSFGGGQFANCDQNLHVIAVTFRSSGGGSSPVQYEARVFFDGNKVRDYFATSQFLSGSVFTCIGGGFYRATLQPTRDLSIAGISTPAENVNTPDTFASAANLFAGDISAVVAYAAPLDDGLMTDPSLTLPTIASVTKAFQQKAVGQW